MGRIWKVIGSVLAVAVIGSFGFCTVWTIRNWDTVYQSLDGSSVYTNEDIKRTEQETWEKAAKNEAEYQKTIAELRDLVTSLQVDNAALSDEVTALTLSISSNESEIRQLSIRKANLETQVTNLQSVNTQNEITIQELNSQIILLQAQADQVPGLNTQIANLQALVTQLQTTNQINSDIITSLNAQIVSLNNQIRELSAASQNASTRITVLTNRCNELQASINYYEGFISQLENDNKVVATYEFGGAIWKIEILNKGTNLTLPVPDNTDMKTFNGWKVTGQDEVLGATYIVNENTKFVADVTYKYSVKFMVDDQVYDSQLVTENDAAVAPANPTKNGYVFRGWSLNGVDLVSNIDTATISENTTYHAIFAKVYQVAFMVDEQVFDNQQIVQGGFATVPASPAKDGYEFQGWSLNGQDIVYSIENTSVTSNITYHAVFAKIHTVSFIVDDQVFNTQQVFNYNVAAVPVNPIKVDYEFCGWSLNGVDVVQNINYAPVTNDTVYYAVFAKIHTVTFIVDDQVYATQKVTNGNFADTVNVETSGTFNGWTVDGQLISLPSYKILSDTVFTADISYIFDTWESMTWNGVNDIGGHRVVNLGNKIFYNPRNTNTWYELNKLTNTWFQITWNINISISTADNVHDFWSDGTNYYYSRLDSQYVVDLDNYILTPVTWKLSTGAEFEPTAKSVWSDGNNIYHDKRYILIKGTNTWASLNWSWEGSGTLTFDRENIWTDMENYYVTISNKNYLIDFATHTFKSIDYCNGVSGFRADMVWHEGNNTYYNCNSGKSAYKCSLQLDPNTRQWIDKAWNIQFGGRAVWNDGKNIYYSNSDEQYILTASGNAA